MQISVNEVVAFSDCGYHYVSLDAPFCEDGDNNRIDELMDEKSGPTDKGVDHGQSLQIEIKRVLGTLDKKQSDILCKFFGIGIPHPLSLREIGCHYDMSAERIRQIRDVALRQLKNGPRKELLKVFLGV